MYELTKVTPREMLNTAKLINFKPTINEMLNRFIEFLDVESLTIRSYRSGIKMFISFLEEKNIVNPKREDIVNFKTALMEKGRKASTVALYLSAVRRFFSWSASEKLYPNIAQGVKSPKQDSSYHKRDYLNATQINTMLKHTDSKRNYAMLLLMSVTGLRTIEVVRADVGDIHTVDGMTLLNVQGKGRNAKSEFVKLPEPVVKALKEYLSERGNVNGNEPLFVSESRRNRGKRLTTRTVSGVAKQAMKRAGYDSPRLTAHSLRHSAATLALLSGRTLEDVSQFLRHSSISVTMVYSHHVQRLKSLCESSVCDSIFGLRKGA